MRVTAIDLDTSIRWLAIDLGGTLWPASSSEIDLGDGRRFERVYEAPDDERHLTIQTMGGSHGCTFAVAASFKSPQPQLVRRRGVVTLRVTSLYRVKAEGHPEWRRRHGSRSSSRLDRRA
jgi:hypothetical protein